MNWNIEISHKKFTKSYKKYVTDYSEDILNSLLDILEVHLEKKYFKRIYY